MTDDGMPLLQKDGLDHQVICVVEILDRHSHPVAPLAHWISRYTSRLSDAAQEIIGVACISKHRLRQGREHTEFKHGAGISAGSAERREIENAKISLADHRDVRAIDQQIDARAQVIAGDFVIEGVESLEAIVCTKFLLSPANRDRIRQKDIRAG